MIEKGNEATAFLFSPIPSMMKIKIFKIAGGNLER